jgi:hypothetical protein
MADERVRPTHTLIDWGPAIAGAIIAIAIGQLLGMLGVAIDATVLNPFDVSRGEATGLSIGGGLWTAFSYLVALQVGGFVATRASPLDDGHRGYLQALLVWSLVFVVTIFITALGISLGAAGIFAMNPTPDPTMLPAAAMTVEGVPITEDMAAAAAVDQAAETTAAFAWWFVAATVLGLIGALIGGRLGEQPAFWDYWSRTPRTTPPPPVTPTT